MIRKVFSIRLVIAVPLLLAVIYNEMKTDMISNFRGIDVLHHFTGFESLRDSNARYVVELLVDVPGKGDKNRIRFKDGYAGHCFLRFTKSNSDKTITRSIGFYPIFGPVTILYKGQVLSKFENDEGHDYDASFIAVVSKKNFDNSLRWIGQVGRHAYYDIDNFNCADFGILVFNMAKGSRPVKVEKEKVVRGWLTATTPAGVMRVCRK